MNIVFKICKYNTCGLTITGLEREDQQYSDNITPNTYRYIDTISLNVLVHVTKDNQDELPYDQYEIIEHTQERDTSIFNFPKDGLFKVIHAIIPTKEWWDAYKLNNYNYYKHIYYYHSGKFYKVVDGETSEVELYEILNVNYNGNCTIYKGVQYTFNRYNIEKCLYSFSQDFLNKMCSDKCNIDADVKNRDLIFMSVHILKYLIDLGRYFEAQELIEKLYSCTGICKQIIKKTSNSGGCGCQA